MIMKFSTGFYQLFVLTVFVAANHERQIDHLEAVANIRGFKGITGAIYFAQSYSSNAPVAVIGKIKNLPKGPHGLHIHQYGNLTDNCDSTGPHFNPDLVGHGGPDDDIRHAGDLGNLEGGPLAEGGFAINDNRISLFGRNSIVGRSVVIHENKDDFGKAKNLESVLTGNTGKRIACGIIAWKNVVISS